jgi:hypothetical protein
MILKSSFNHSLRRRLAMSCASSTNAGSSVPKKALPPI